VPAGLDVDSLARAVDQAVARYEILRTGFPEVAILGTAVQVIQETVRLPLRSIAIEETPGGERAAIEEVLRDHRAVLRLDAPPLLRCTVVTSPAGQTLVLSAAGLISDVVSVRLLAAEILAVAADPAAGPGGRAPDPSPALQYADYAEWRAGLIEEAEEAIPIAAQDFWAGQVASLDPAGTTVTAAAPEYARIPVDLAPGTWAGIEAAAQRLGVSPRAWALAAWMLLLDRLDEGGHVAVVTDNRSHPEFTAAIGRFEQRLPVAALPVTGRFGDFVTTVESLLAAADRWARYAPAAPGRVGFRYDGYHDPRVIVAVADTYPLELCVSPATGTATITYDGTERTGGDVTVLAERLAAVMARCAAEPDPPVTTVDIRTSVERLIAASWQTPAPDPLPASVPHRFLAQARATPDATALIHLDERTSYAELDARARAVAATLIARGVTPGELVGLCLPNGPDQVAAVLGVWYAGAAYVAASPDDPAVRVESLLRGATVILVGPGAPIRGVPVAECVGSLRDEEFPEPGALAYLAYTSGSTGTPRGVAGHHRAVAGYLDYVISQYQITAEDVAVQLAPFTFDAWLRAVLPPLLTGGVCVLVDADSMRSGTAIVGLLARHRVTRILHTVPTLLRDLARAGADRSPPRLRTVLCSGEALRSADCTAIWATFGSQVDIVNQYGPTECTMTSTFQRAGHDHGNVPIGHPVPGMRLHLLDDESRPCPVGMPGEVFLGGTGLAFGYLGQPSATAERFVPDPFGPPGERLYRTGDLARYSLHGSIELIGRRDHQVKVRGVRIEPGEIESVLSGHQAVRECAVLAVGDGEPSLAAWVVVEGEVPDLRAWLARRLPAYLVPAVVTAVGRLPRSPHGKIDRRALAATVGGPVPTADDTSRPGSALTAAVAAAFARTLELPYVGPQDDFFALGGHSLMATQLIYDLNESLGTRAPLRAIFEHPTVEGLAEHIRSQSGDPLEIVPVTGSGPHPLSFAQRRLWLVHALRPADTSHNVQVTARIAGAVDLGALRMALRRVIARHEMLRTTFHAGDDGEPGQVVHDTSPVELEVLAPAGAEEISRVSRERAATPFRLDVAPLWSIAILASGPGEHLLLLTMHHIIVDEWSVGLLLRDLTDDYAAEVAGQRQPVGETPLRYLDYAAWQRRRLDPARLETLLDGWRERLAGAAFEIDLPYDRPRPPVSSNVGDRLALAVPGTLVARLTAIGREHRATLFMTLLAAYAALLAHHSGTEDIVVGAPVAGRDRAELDEVVGCFANILVLRTRLDGSPSFAELIERVREVALHGYAHAETPFEKLVETLRPDRILGRMPLVQNWFVLHNAARPVLRAGGIEVTLIESDRGSAKFDLNLALSLTEEGLSAAIEYSTDVFDRPTALRLLRQYLRLLERVAAEPTVGLDEAWVEIEQFDRRERAVAAEDRQKSSRKSFQSRSGGVVAPVRVSEETLVRVDRLPGGGSLPLVYSPGAGQVDLATWIGGNRAAVTARLHTAGAILFRGFELDSVEAFEAAVKAYSPSLLDYYERSTPRHAVSGKVYTSTEYPPERQIPLHPESAYSHYWPRTLWFCCLTAAQTGGATPIADSRRILAALDPRTRRRFAERGVMYIRNYHDGFDIPWQVAFQTQERAVVEEYCRKAGMEWEWRSGGVLRTRHVLDAVVRHPETAEEVWFNQVHAWHISTLDPDAQRSMLDMFAAEDLPRNVCYGDGEPIDETDIEAVRAAHATAIERFPWQSGDTMLIDNMLVAHGRDPFSGSRRVVVAMSDPFDRDALRALA
jgi:amino acid adenylation domain-containing protein